MTIHDVKHIVHGRPGRDHPASSRAALDAVASRGLLTWWDLMSDLDPGWLAWSERLHEGWAPRRRVA